MRVDQDYLKNQVRHWLETPAGAYLGSTYGENIKDGLHASMNLDNADAVIAKMRADLPVLALCGQDQVGVFAQDVGADTQRFVLLVAGAVMDI